MESHLIDLANGLAARNHDVFLITGTRPDALEFDNSVQLVYTPELDLFRRKDLRAATSTNFADTLDQLVSTLHPNVVHGHNLDHFGGRANSRSLSVIQVTLGSHELECPDLVAADPFRGFLDGVHVFHAE